MNQIPNHKARLSRAIRNNLPLDSAVSLFKKSKLITVAMVVISPFYPSLASIGVESVARGYYDESTIISEEYEYPDLETTVSTSGLVSLDAKEQIQSGTLAQQNREEPKSEENTQEQPEKTNEPKPPETPQDTKLQIYTVKKNDNIVKIAKKYNINAEAILWKNNVDMSDTLTVGQKLTIPEESGLVHTIQRGETLSQVSATYDVASAKITKANNISDPTKIRIGQKILVPGATPPKKEEPKTEAPVSQVASTPVKKPVSQPKSKPQKQPVKSPVTVNPATGLKSSYLIKYTGLGRGMAPGNCTWYVARNKTVTWRGNANMWLRNAKRQGKPTGNVPVPGAIVQFTGYGYSAAYGHVGIVTAVYSDHFIVKDMNYAGLYKVTTRKIPRNHPSIDGFIYVD